MAKPVESSAINHLINMVATRTPPVRDPAEDLADLMFRVPPARPVARTLPPPPFTPVRSEAPATRSRPTTQAPPVAPPLAQSVVPSRMAPEPQSLTDLAATIPVRKRPPEGAFEDPGSVASLVHARSAPASRQPPVRVLDISPPPVAPRPRTGRHAPVIVEDGPSTDQTTDEFEGTTDDRATAPATARSAPGHKAKPVPGPRQPRPSARRDVAAPTTTPPLRMPSAAPYDRPLDFANVSVDVPPARDGTAQIVRRPPWRHFARTLALPMLALFVVGAGIGGYAALRKRHHTVTSPPAGTAEALASASTPTVAPHARTPGALESAVLGPEAVAPVAAPAVAAAVEPAPEPAPTPPTPPHALVEVRIDSTPSGATVMMVDRGTTTPIGTTPLFASVDPSRPYELVFTLADHPTRVLALDAARTVRIAAALDDAPAPAPAPAPSHASSHASSAKHRTTGTPPAPAAVEARGTGILMISSKPPCQISIDGKPTGLTTPQRAISLSAGRHSITLVNTAAGVKKTVTATIKADTSTKVIQDLMPE